jgi:hypothetical protein
MPGDCPKQQLILCTLLLLLLSAEAVSAGQLPGVH